MEKRKNFYANEMNIKRMEEELENVISKLTLKEILKMIREISYDMVCYYDNNTKGIIYQNNTYTERNREQACCLQRLLSSACDLFGQSIIEHREFDEGYLNKFLNGGSMELQIQDLKNQIKSLQTKLEEMEQQ